jgi:hypothetical protein
LREGKCLAFLCSRRVTLAACKRLNEELH